MACTATIFIPVATVEAMNANFPRPVVNYYRNRKNFNRAGRWGVPLDLPKMLSMKGWRGNQTWDVASEIESQHPVGAHEPDDEASIPITHSQTAPGRIVNGYISESRKETDAHDMEPYTQPPSGETSGDSQRTAIGGPSTAPDLLRRRVPSNDSALSPGATEMVAETGKLKRSRTFFKHLSPKEPFTVGNQLRRTLLYSPLNILILAAPVGIALNYVTSIPRVAIFVINFLAIVPLAALLSYGTEEVALRLGETLGGLLNATLGNAVEL